MIKPLSDRIVVKRSESVNVTASGIVLVDPAVEKMTEGEVIAVGRGSYDKEGNLIPMEVRVGDRIIFGKFAGHGVKIDGKDVLIMTERDVMGVL